MLTLKSGRTEAVVRGAVPLLLRELLAALVDGLLDAGDGCSDAVRVLRADLTLLPREGREAIAVHLPRWDLRRREVRDEPKTQLDGMSAVSRLRRRNMNSEVITIRRAALTERPIKLEDPSSLDYCPNSGA